MVGGRPQDANNIQPRLGFAYQLNDRTVIRGGAGLYYTDIIASSWTHSTRANTTVFLAVDNDGRPDFATNPFNGPAPTYEQALQRVCDVNRRRSMRGAHQLRRHRALPVPRLRGTGAARRSSPRSSNSWQGSIGFQRQIGTDMSIEVDYVHNRSRDEKVLHDNVEPRLQPGDRRQLPVRGERAEPRAAAVPEVRARSATTRYTGRSDYHGAADGVDQAVQQPVAGVGHLHAVARSRTTSRRSR